MSTAEDIREVGTMRRWQAGAWSATTHTNSPAVHSISGSQSTRITVGHTVRLGGNSTQQPFEQYMRMIENFSARASQPISVHITPPAAVQPANTSEDAIWDAVAKATPSKEKLLAIAKKFTPPDSWFDEKDVF